MHLLISSIIDMVNKLIAIIFIVFITCLEKDFALLNKKLLGRNNYSPFNKTQTLLTPMLIDLNN